MTTFDEIWTQGVDDARDRLRSDNPAAAALARRIRQPSFPAAVTLLGASHRDDGPTGPEFIRSTAASAAANDDVRAAGVSRADAADILDALFVRRVSPSDSDHSSEAISALLEHGLADANLPVSRQEADEIVQMLETGRFYGDFVSTAGAIFHTIPALPTALLRDLPNLATLPFRAPGSIFDDFFALFTAVPRVVADLRDGRIDEPPATMVNFLSVLYGLATVDRIRDLMRRLLDPRNRSVRLAIMLYARSNGFDVRDENLDVVSDSLFATSEPDLGPVLAEALEVMERRYGAQELQGVLAALRRS